MESPNRDDRSRKSSTEADKPEACPSETREECSQESITESKVQAYPTPFALTLIILSLALPFFLVALDRTIIGTAM